MKKSIYSIVAIFLFTVAAGVHAEKRSVTDARSLASQFATKAVNGRMMRPAIQSARLTFAYTEKSVAGDTSFVYVFNRGTSDGYVVVSAEDRTVPVLGYADRGTFDPTHIPENMKGWLQEYANQIRQIIRSNIKASTTAAADTARYTTAVEALLGDISWDQGEPYNNLAPKENGITCDAGCVATAMAQIMRYHQWPAKGIGSHSYAWNDTILSSDFSSHSYDWANMTPIYGWNSTEKEKNAVATLMYDCGVSLNMKYGTSGSGAFAFLITDALPRYFGYNSTIERRHRFFYSSQEWDGIIKAELDAKRPVLYEGQSAIIGGHAFVCDGYDRQGYFHFNWGWGGSANGYFLTSVLWPGEHNLGNAGFNFSIQQNILIGIETPKENPNPQESTYHIRTYMPFQLIPSTSEFSRNSPIPLSIPEGMFYNEGSKIFIGDFGFGIYNEKGQRIRTVTAIKKDTLGTHDGINEATSFDLSLADMANGSYEMWPMCKPIGGDWDRLNYYQSAPPVVCFNVTDSLISATFGKSPWKLMVSSMNTSSLYINRKASLTVTLKNLGEEYSGDINIYLLDKKTLSVVKYITCMYVDMQQGESRNLIFCTSYDAEPGDYFLALTDDFTNPISMLSVTLNPEPEASNLAATDDPIVRQTASNIEVTMKLTNKGGFYSDDLYFIGYKLPFHHIGDYMTIEKMDKILLDTNDTATLKTNVNISSLASGEYCFLLIDIPSWNIVKNKNSNYLEIPFTIQSATGIEKIGPDNLNGDTAPYYNLQGVKVNKPLQKGIYIHNGKKVYIKAR